jgi:hypothetical protein
MIQVEVKVIGMFGADFVAATRVVDLKDGAKPKDAIVALYKAGAIEKAVYKQIKSLRPPFYLVHNDTKVEGKPKNIVLQNGDSLGVMQLMAGG